MLTVINDCHIGAKRSAGTTLESAKSLRQHILKSYKELLPDSDLLINGDLFDSYQAPLEDFCEVYTATRAWLKKGYTLHIAVGNHDLSKDSSKLSSCQALGNLLHDEFPWRAFLVEQPTTFTYGHIIPHMVNQEAFNQALAAVPECEALYLHCNYDNNFAAQTDHSLNITKEQVESCPAKRVVLGHEHQMRDKGKVLIPGNQIPTSISDWLGATKKYKVVDGKLVALLSKDTEFAELDWKQLGPTEAKFVRITGECKVEEFNLMLEEVAKYRESSKAFVVSCAVEALDQEGLKKRNSETLESLQKFNVLNAIQNLTTEEEFEKVKSLLC